MSLLRGSSCISPLLYKGESPAIKQDTILVEAETQFADQVLENIFTSMLDGDSEKWPITG